jgi:hypothetical protein
MDAKCFWAAQWRPIPNWQKRAVPGNSCHTLTKEVRGLRTLGVVNPPVSDLATLLRTMEPVLHEGVYVYSVVPANTELSSAQAIATFQEAEG